MHLEALSSIAVAVSRQFPELIPVSLAACFQFDTVVTLVISCDLAAIQRRIFTRLATHIRKMHKPLSPRTQSIGGAEEGPPPPHLVTTPH